MKKIIGVYSAPHPHWVGDGFLVNGLFSYSYHAKELSPFLMLDYSAPAYFSATSTPRGIGAHPHRGFEIVTIVYNGEIEHRDSQGNGGLIGPGDAQWMTAGSGIIHEEFHSPAFCKTGGEMELVHLWVNLPTKYKMTKPAYQSILKERIPTVALRKQNSRLRVVAGSLEGYKGPARTFTPMNIFDLRLQRSEILHLRQPEGWTTALFVLHGSIRLNGDVNAHQKQMALLDRKGEQLIIEASSDAVVLLLAGEAIDEPIVGHGPFVMNSQQEIRQAISDYKNGLFGQLLSKRL